MISASGDPACTTRGSTPSTAPTSSTSTKNRSQSSFLPIYGLKGVGLETFTGEGPISYWNSYVGVSQMGGQGDFEDDRLPVPLDIDQDPDLVTPKLPALLQYQLSLKAPKPPKDSFNHAAAARGRKVFDAACASCHVPPLYTDVNDHPDPSQPLLHDPDEVGADDAYADRGATKEYRTTPLRALWQHPRTSTTAARPTSRRWSITTWRRSSSS